MTKPAARARSRRGPLSTALRMQNAYTHGRNLAYYRRKWGGDPGEEAFSTPFGDPALALRIAPESRRAPHGQGYNRDDLSAARR